MPKSTYVKEPRNARAVAQVRSWLTAIDVPVKTAARPSCDLSVVTAAGLALDVKVGMEADEARPLDAVFILAPEMTGKGMATAMEAFRRLTEAAGYGSPVPVDRGPEPGSKLSFRNDFELVAMRHCEFRKAPNPNPEELRLYDQVINRAVAKFRYMNNRACIRNLIQAEDLKTYAQVWTCNYLGLYKVPDHTGDDNFKKLTVHLNQRFANFAEVLYKKERSCLPDAATAAAGLLVEGPDLVSWHPYDRPEDFVEVAIPEAQRRRDAKETLRALLNGLPHESLLETLNLAALNEHICPDARREAIRQLGLHRAGCDLCPVGEAEDEVTGAEGLGHSEPGEDPI